MTDDTTAPQLTPNWWNLRTTPTPPAGYAEMIEAMRELQDTLAAAVPDEALVAETTDHLRRAAELLAPSVKDEWSRISGFVDDLPGRGSAMLPVLRDPHTEDGVLRGTVRFGRFHLGGNGAAHGGTLPLLFDDVLGRFTNIGRPVARTAYLHVDFRSITPVERDLQLEARVTHEEGRKRWATGVIRDGETVCAEAEGLFVELRPGQL